MGSNIRNLAVLILTITVFTRFNYYAARIAAEKRARAFERSVESAPSSSVILSLQPRTLRNYTNWWVEAGIVLALSAATIWVAVGTTNSVIRFVVINLYLQAGLLLISMESFVPVGPLRWTTWSSTWRGAKVCGDTPPERATSRGLCLRCNQSLHSVSGRGEQFDGSLRFAFSVAAIAIIVYEWDSRRRHLEMVRRTKPARLPLLPDFERTRSVLDFGRRFRYFCSRPRMATRSIWLACPYELPVSISRDSLASGFGWSVDS